MLSFLGFDGISTLAEDAKDPRKDIGRATILVCFIAGGLFILQTYLGQLIWPDYSTFNPVETAFSDIGRRIGGPALAYLIASLVIAQAWASAITSQASASRLLFAMSRDGRLPHPIFGYMHPKLRTPTHSMLLMGGIAMVAGLFLDLDKAAELVNFGACAGFMAVNLSVIGCYFVQRRERNLAWALEIPGVAVDWLPGVLLDLAKCLASGAPVGMLWSFAGVLYLLRIDSSPGCEPGRTGSGKLTDPYFAVYPPSTIRQVPVIKEASSEARNKIALATSSACTEAIQEVKGALNRQIFFIGQSRACHIGAQLRCVDTSGSYGIDTNFVRREIHRQTSIEAQ